MTDYFLDSSALVKRYVPETGTAWIQALTAPNTGNQLHIARITWVEVLSAVARRQREGTLGSAQVAAIIAAFRFHLDTQYQVIELDQALCEAAGQLLLTYPLRAYDAVQLASGLQLQSTFASLVFLTADTRLIAIAQAEGLMTDNPNTHP